LITSSLLSNIFHIFMLTKNTNVMKCFINSSFISPLSIFFKFSFFLFKKIWLNHSPLFLKNYYHGNSFLNFKKKKLNKVVKENNFFLSCGIGDKFYKNYFFNNIIKNFIIFFFLYKNFKLLKNNLLFVIICKNINFNNYKFFEKKFNLTFLSNLNVKYV
jgi:hypothetical protein